MSITTKPPSKKRARINALASSVKRITPNKLSTMKAVVIDVDEAIDRISAKDGSTKSVTQLAKDLGLSGTKTLHNWKSGEYLKTVGQLKALADMAGMTLDELIKEKNG